MSSHLTRAILDPNDNEVGQYHCYPAKQAQGVTGYFLAPCYPCTYGITFPEGAGLEDRIRLMGKFQCF